MPSQVRDIKKIMKLSKKNVVFVNLPSIPYADIEASFNNKNFHKQSISMPLGLMYISSYLKKYGNAEKVSLLDYVIALVRSSDYKNMEDFVTSLDIKFTPDVIAFSLNFSASYVFFEKCLGILKRKWPEAIVVVGGVHATNTTAKLLELNNVDYVVRGEAERSFSEFINQLSLQKKISVQGIYSKDNISDATALKISDLVVDLDELPFPGWELIDMEAYVTSLGRQREMGTEHHRTASLFTTRGCPFQCIFCSAHTVHGRKMRFRSAENIAEEIKLLYQKYGVNLFMPEDDLFIADKERALKKLKAIKDLNIPGLEIQLPAGLSVNTLDVEIIDELISVGLKIACLAIESGSEYVQRNIIKKNCDLKKARWLVDLFKIKGLIVRCFFILGFPGETREQMQETIDYAKSLKIDWCLFPIATPLVGSEMYDKFVEMGAIRDDIDTWSNTDFSARKFDTPEITAKELNDFVYKTNLDFNFINNPNFVNGKFEKAISIYKDILSRHPFHVIAWYCIMQCYKSLGEEDRSRETEKILQELIKTDERAADMFIKYGDLLQGFGI